MSEYRCWDREEKLGSVPEGGFKPTDPKVIAWEAAHGHDLRLKCYPEFGCLLIPDFEDMVDRVQRVLADFDALDERCQRRVKAGDFADAVRGALKTR